MEAEALVGLGRLHARAGRVDEAAVHLGEALQIAQQNGAPNDIAMASSISATLPGGDAAAATKTLEDLANRPWHTARMESRWWLWKATADTAHLAESSGWGLLATAEGRRIPGARVTSLTQQHAVADPGTGPLPAWGARLRVLPNHSCLAAACHERFVVVRGIEIVDEWTPEHGW